MAYLYVALVLVIGELFSFIIFNRKFNFNSPIYAICDHNQKVMGDILVTLRSFVYANAQHHRGKS